MKKVTPNQPIYVLQGGYVKSATDNQTHFITANKLYSLYGLNRTKHQYIVLEPEDDQENNRRLLGYDRDWLVFLGPRADGNYTLPELEMVPASKYNRVREQCDKIADQLKSLDIEHTILRSVIGVIGANTRSTQFFFSKRTVTSFARQNSVMMHLGHDILPPELVTKLVVEELNSKYADSPIMIKKVDDLSPLAAQVPAAELAAAYESVNKGIIIIIGPRVPKEAPVPIANAEIPPDAVPALRDTVSFDNAMSKLQTLIDSADAPEDEEVYTRTCEVCDGDGDIVSSQNGRTLTSTCHACNGSGRKTIQ